MKKKIPKFKSDEEVTNFLDQDMSDYLHNDNFKHTSFEFEAKDKSVTIRMSDHLLSSVQCLAKKKKIPYQRLIRQAVEDYLKRSDDQFKKSA